ncbi:ATP-binding cassette domain-containing protein [Rhizobium lentis]|nr:ATP-binding cassette domain-containing protein [Rhizobium lentis]MBX5015581.1 ATP-binding cassette domain-containing protein [Rhizobium lentis]MBX5044037.1 ATP-binding cassette domain-containing protein [Rhizobium lentis]MBX5054662.1 ATP-binding cassette domain-containing protein [Rhizobium lentis]MBX5070368.1 ATP-binding cassette domain-containing protein [Rhizobium lentis]
MGGNELTVISVSRVEPIEATSRESGEGLSPNPARAIAVSFDGVGKTYDTHKGPVHALKDIAIDVARGSIFGIIGRSGAGKSSLLRTVNRLETATEGSVVVDGVDVRSLSDDELVTFRRKVGMIFQHFNLLSAKTVWGNVALPLIVAGVPKLEIDERVSDVLRLVGLEGKQDAYPSRLSGGQKQRVGIARALVNRPEILLCDEATSALDPETTLSILELLKDINRSLGITILLITHEMSVVREICDDVVVLEGGQVAEAGKTWEIFSKPAHAATKALLKPLEPGIPRDIADRLTSAREHFHQRALIELTYGGNGREGIKLQELARVVGSGVQIVQSMVDRIQGHAYGRMLLTTNADDQVALSRFEGLADNVRILGYVRDDV